jgi:hypothetical protein
MSLPTCRVNSRPNREDFAEACKNLGILFACQKLVDKERLQAVYVLRPSTIRTRVRTMEYMITLVHGTFARRAEWVQEGSRLRRHLAADLSGHSVTFRTFRWSGRNNFKARRLAAERLQEYLSDAIKSHPTAKHAIVAHSHGGNVALYALRNDNLKSHIDAVVCLSTPFLHVRPRPLDEDTRDIVMFAIGLSLLVFALFTSDAFPWIVVTAAAAVVTSVVVGILLKRWNPYAHRVSQDLALPSLSPEFPLLLVRVNGDEASEGLGSVSIAAWFGRTLIDSLINGRLLGWRPACWNAIRERLKTKNPALDTFVAIQVLLLGYFFTRDKALPAWTYTHRGSLALFFIPTILTIFVLLTSMVVISLRFLGALLSVPLSLVITLLSAIFVGLDLPLIGLAVEVSSEPAPPGPWLLHQFWWPTSSSGLLHSQSYQYPPALEAISNFLNKVGRG